MSDDTGPYIAEEHLETFVQVRCSRCGEYYTAQRGSRALAERRCEKHAAPALET